MHSFIVRVELHGAQSESTYLHLHNAMGRAGFSRTILADDARSYWLPQAMYKVVSTNATQVRQAASKAAATTGFSATVFVAQMSEWSASGLVQVQGVSSVTAK
jgi:hypothetical protein